MQPSQSPKPVAPIRSADTYSPRHSAVTTETKGVISRCQVGPSKAVIVVPDRVDTARKFAPGNSGVDGDQAAQDFFNRRQEITKLPIERQKIRISVTDPKTGTVYTRYYDGLEPVPGQPGKYTGLEHKYGSGRLTPQQAIVDDLVNEGADARGTLDGKPIQVVKALEFNTAAVAAPAPPAEAAGPAEAPRAPLAEAGPARAPPLVEAPEVPKLPLAEAAPDLLPHGYGGFGPTIPTPVPPPHSIGHLPVLGRDDPNAPWEYEEK